MPFGNYTAPDASNPNGDMPKAYLTILFFDERFNFVEESSISDRVEDVGDGAEPLNLPNIKAPKNGYAYIYISNESSEPVYFDNIQITHERKQIIEENHYYAYGLKIAAISSRKFADPNEGGIRNQYLYNDKELWEDADLNWYDYGFRNYDPQIGRFPQLDPLTWEYEELTNFQYASNDPINNIDIDGLEGGLSTVGGIWNGSFLQAGKSVGQFLKGGALGIWSGVRGIGSFVLDDMWKSQTWKQIGNQIGALAIAQGFGPGGNPHVIATTMQEIDKKLGTNFGETYGDLTQQLDQLIKDIPNMGPEDAGKLVGEILVAIFTTKGVGAATKAAKLRIVKYVEKKKSVPKPKVEKLDLVSKVQAKINLYPNVVDPRTGRNIGLPSVSKITPKANRVVWDSKARGNFIKEWYDRGYKTPKGGWDKYDIHHIKPREFGGSNEFWNLVPVERSTHKLFNSFWSQFGQL